MNDNITPRSVTEKNSVCFVGIMCNEHDFFPQMIEHHVKCGISQFVLLINDYGLETPQPEYNVPDEYKEIVTLIRVNDELVNEKGVWTKSKEKLCVSFNKPHLVSANFIMCALNDFGFDKSIIKTEWILAIGMDQYLSLEQHDSVPEFLNTLVPECDQVFIPWSCLLFNGSFQLKDTISEVINQDDTFMFSPVFDVPYWTSGFKQKVHFNGLVKKEALVSLAPNTHYFVTKPKSDFNLFVNGVYYKFTSSGNQMSDIWQIQTKEMHEKGVSTDIKNLIIHTVHFHLRGFLELLICNSSWYNHKIIHKFNKDIKDDTDPWRMFAENIKAFLDKNKGFNGNFLHCTRSLGNREEPRQLNYKLGKNLISSKDEKYPLRNSKISSWTYKYKNSTRHYDNYVFEALSKYGITKEQLIEWFNVNLEIRNLQPISEETKQSCRLWFS